MSSSESCTVTEHHTHSLYAVQFYQLLIALYDLRSGYDLRSMIYALRSTLHDLRSTIYSQSTYCNLYLHDLPSKLYQLLLPTLCTLRSTIYAPWSTLYDLRSTICVLRCTLYDQRFTINALLSTLKGLTATFICTIYPLSSTSYS